MKSSIFGLLAAGFLLTPVLSQAQEEHWNEGPVWACGSYRTAPGMFDTYMKWIRSHAEVTNAEAKKQGLILDYRTFVKDPVDPNDYDVLFCTLYSSYGKALDYNKVDDDKLEAIAAKHWATSDEDKQTEMASSRLEMRKYLGTTYVREVTLKPMP
jgi:hypothetical protein